MNNGDTLQYDLPEDEPTGLLSSLPPEMLHEIAIWAPLRTLCRVMRLDVQRIACVRLQRWYRSIERHGKMQLCVGDRVLVRSRAARGQVEYATAAAEVDEGRSWKVRMLDGLYFTVPTSHIRRLADWTDGPWASSVGRSAALSSESRAAHRFEKNPVGDLHRRVSPDDLGCAQIRQRPLGGVRAHRRAGHTEGRPAQFCWLRA